MTNKEKNSPRVLLVTLEYPPFFGGVANYYDNLIKYWPENDRIFVLNNNGGELINKKRPFLKWLPSIRKINNEIKKNKIDHVMVGHLLPLGTAMFLISKFTKTPYSVFIHGMDFDFALKNFRKRILAKMILQNAKHIFCANSYVADKVKKILQESDKVFVVNPGIDMNHELRIMNHELRKKYNLGDNFVLLTVGRLVKRKGVDKVLESLPAVIKTVPNLKYIILGNGPEIENYKLRVANFGLEKHVNIITDASDQRKWAWYDACDIFIMPSREIKGDYEGFGIVYLEANLAEKPVIAGDSGGVRDAVMDGVNGILVNPDETGEIAKAILRLANDKEYRLKLGKNGYDRAINNFSWEGQVKKIFNIISS